MSPRLPLINYPRRYVDAARCFNAVLLYIYRVKAAHRNSPQVGYQRSVRSVCMRWRWRGAAYAECVCMGGGGVNGSLGGCRAVAVWAQVR